MTQVTSQALQKGGERNSKKDKSSEDCQKLDGDGEDVTWRDVTWQFVPDM